MSTPNTVPAPSVYFQPAPVIDVLREQFAYLLYVTANPHQASRSELDRMAEISEILLGPFGPGDYPRRLRS